MSEKINIDEKSVERALGMMNVAMSDIERETGVLILSLRPSRSSFMGPSQEIAYINTKMNTIGAVYNPIPEGAIPQEGSWEAVEKVFHHLDERRGFGRGAAT